MSLTGGGASPFVLRAVDGGPPASGEGAVALTVGDHVEPGAETTGVDYVAGSTIIGGDIGL